jgi:translation initiation factor IF-3
MSRSEALQLAENQELDLVEISPNANPPVVKIVDWGKYNYQKMRKVTSFLEAGHKVKITLVFRGRELAHKDIGFKLAERVIADFGESIAVDQQPQLNGKQLSFVIRSTGKPAKPAEAKE